VVDDDDFGRETLGRILEVAGYGVQRAADGAEALRCLARGPLPGLIVLDLFMPRIDGWGFCARRRRDPRLASIPILVVSAADGAALCQDFAGIVGLLEKPVAVPELLAVIRHYCRPG
jgi:CheY-like chemotaxis protein